MIEVVVGVVGIPLVTRVVRAVSGVGALIKDFFGVSGTTLLLRLLEKAVDDEPKNAFAVLGAGLATFARERTPVMYGWRRAADGFSLRSGSHTRHLAMKSTKSESSHRRTWARVLLPARLLLPFEFTHGRGAPVWSVKED